MKKPCRVGVVGLKAAMLGALTLAALGAAATPPKLGGPGLAVGSATVRAPVERLMIRYHAGIKTTAQAGAAGLAHERMQAAAQVARSADAAGELPLSYLKSVSERLHVVTLAHPVSAAEAQTWVQRLHADPAVADVVIDHRMQAHQAAPNDPRFGDESQWHLMDSSAVPGGINAAAAWDSSAGAGVVVAVLDGGYRPHADLAGNLLTGYDFISADTGAKFHRNYFWTANDGDARDGDAQDPGDWVTATDVSNGLCSEADDSSWHGTHVAGIVAATGYNHRDGLGVAYGARILPVRVLGRCGGYSSDVLAGARWAAGLSVPGLPANPTPAKILNLSLGNVGTCNATTQAVVDEIRASNVSIVASVGNDGSTQITVPANCRGVVAVTAHTREGDNAGYANVGAGVSISAPGGGSNTVFPTPATGGRGVLSTWNTGATGPGSDAFAGMAGTSMAAPQVAGVLALVASRRPDLPMATLEEIVINAVRPFPAGGYCATNRDRLAAGFCGSGLLDAQRAVDAAAAHVASATVPGSESDSGGGGGGGGGCSVAANGQADASLGLLALGGLLMLLRRRSLPQAARPASAE